MAGPSPCPRAVARLEVARRPPSLPQWRGGGALWELEGCLRPLSLWACSSGLHALPAGASLPAGPFSHAAYTSPSCVSFCVLVSKVTEW